MNQQAHTEKQFREIIAQCRDIFEKKMHDYDTAWCIMRAPSLTDQIFIKAKRIRTLESGEAAMVDEGIRPEFVAIVNYSLMGMIALENACGVSLKQLLPPEKALALYDAYADETLALMIRKNHDYDEAWRSMRVSSYTDLILMKLLRTKQIENLGGKTLVSEGIKANYQDMMNYAIFALIKLSYPEE